MRCTPNTTWSPADTRNRMAAWNTPPRTMVTRCWVIRPGRTRRPPHRLATPGGGRAPSTRTPVAGPRAEPPAARGRSDLPAVDPVDELRANRLHRLPGRHDLDRLDRDEVVPVLVGRDALIEVAHLDVILAPAPRARQRLHLDAGQRLRHLLLRRPLARGSVRLLDRGLVGLGTEVRVVALVRRVLVVLGLVLADELLEQRATLRIVEVHRVVTEEQAFGREVLLEGIVHAAGRREHALHALEEPDGRGLLHDDRRVP